MKFRKKPVVVEVSEPWWKLGDLLGEGVEDVWVYPGADSNSECQECLNAFWKHGRIKTLEGWHIVCPGDRIVTGIRGEKYPIKPDIFEQTYEPAE